MLIRGGPSPAVQIRQDRTQDFLLFAQQLQSQQGVHARYQASDIQDQGQPASLASQSAEITSNLSKCEAKVAQLEKLAQQSSLFDDPTAQIHQISQVITGDLQHLNQQVQWLANVGKQQRAANTSSATHNVAIVDQVTQQLKLVTGRFKRALEVRKERLGQAQARRQHYSAADFSSQSAIHSQQIRRRQGGAANSEGQAYQSNYVDLQQLEEDDKHHELPSFMQKQQHIEFRDSALQAKKEALSHVESAIMEIGGIFQQLASLVQDQQDMMVRIDQNMDATLDNVDNAKQSVLKYFKTISANRQLMLKLFVVLIVFGLFFVFFYS